MPRSNISLWLIYVPNIACLAPTFHYLSPSIRKKENFLHHHYVFHMPQNDGHNRYYAYILTYYKILYLNPILSDANAICSPHTFMCHNELHRIRKQNTGVAWIASTFMQSPCLQRFCQTSI